MACMANTSCIPCLTSSHFVATQNQMCWLTHDYCISVAKPQQNSGLDPIGLTLKLPKVIDMNLLPITPYIIQQTGDEDTQTYQVKAAILI